MQFISGGQKKAQSYSFLICKRCIKRKVIMCSMCPVLDRVRSNGSEVTIRHIY